MQLVHAPQEAPSLKRDSKVFSPRKTPATPPSLFTKDTLTAEAKQFCHSQGSQERVNKLVSLGERATVIAHEMRNPLCVILNVLNSCKELKVGRLEQTRLALALEEAERLNRMVDGILACARSQEPTLVWQEIKLMDLINEVIHLVSELPIAIDRHIVMAPNLPNVIVRGRHDGLKQVFLNLLINACEAVAPGDAIAIHCHPEFNSRQLLIQIHNGGQSIPPHLLPLLGYQPITTKLTGQGLGLMIVQEIIHTHTGEMTIMSSASQGTKITIRLPVIKFETNQQTHPSPPAHPSPPLMSYSPLSDRELEVLQLIVEGCSNRDIAQQLFISPDTVKTHVCNVLNKLGVSDRTQAAVKALRMRLVQ